MPQAAWQMASGCVALGVEPASYDGEIDPYPDKTPESQNAVDAPVILGRHQRKLLVGADQGLSSATNFGASALAAGLLTAAGFGSFSLAIALYLIMLGINRSWTGDVLLVQPQSGTPEFGASVALSLVIGLSGAVVALVLAWAPFVSGDTSEAFIALAVCLPFLLAQDTHRYGMLVARPSIACASDSSWLILSVCALMVLRRTDTASVPLAVLAWGSGAIPGAIAGMRLIPLSNRRAAVSRWLTSSRQLSSRFTAEFALGSMSGFLMLTTVVALAHDTAAVGAVRGAQILMGPITVVFLATTLYVQPLMAERHVHGIIPSRLGIQQSLVAAAVAIVWLIVIKSVPRSLGVRVFGATWAGAIDAIVYMGLAIVGTALYLGATNELRARHLAHRALVSRAVAGSITVSSTVIGAILGGFQETLLAFAISMLVASCVPWLALAKIRTRPSRIGESAG